MAPVGIFGFTVPSGRGRTRPRTPITHSPRRCVARSCRAASASGLKTTWVIPSRSRRSMKSTPP